MVYEERNAWVGLVVSAAAIAAYIWFVVQQAGGGPLTDVDWVPPMLWTIGLGIAVTIVIGILWGIAAGLRDPKGATASDIRDRDISRMGARIEHAFITLAGIGVIVLCALGAHVFWIANAMFLGFGIATLIGGAARLIAYRRGLV